MAGLLLEAAGQGVDLLGGPGRVLGQLAHLFGDDGESPAGVSGPGRFDGGVQGQQIGLVGDADDGGNEISDLAHRLLELSGPVKSLPALVADSGEGVDDLADLLRRRLGLMPRPFRGLRSRGGRFGRGLGRRGHFLDAGVGLFQGRRVGLRQLSRLIHRGLDLFHGGVRLLRIGGQG